MRNRLDIGPVRAVRYLGPYPSFVDARGVPVGVGEVGLVRVPALPAFGDNIEPVEWVGDARGLEVEPWPAPKPPPASKRAKKVPLMKAEKGKNSPGISAKRKPAKKAAKRKPAKRKPAKKKPAKGRK